MKQNCSTLRRTFELAAALATVIVVTAPVTADAAIRCSRGFQLNSGQEISTPYCQDNYLAEVAREYGVAASAERVRNNPNYKRELCRFVGRDIRVQQNCIDEQNSRGGRF